MSPSSDPRIDVVSAATALIALWAGGEIAPFAGPYIVIAASGIVGGTIYVQRRQGRTPRFEAIGWVLLLAIVSVLLTSSVASLVEIVLQKFGWGVPTRYLLSPVAVLIAAVGPDWPDVLRWGIDRLPWRGRVGASNGQ